MRKYFKNSQKKFKNLIGFIFFCVICYYLFKFTIGVPILNVPNALKKADKATFIYVEENDDIFNDTYFYVIFDNREMYSFYGIAKYYNRDKILDSDYMRVVYKAQCKYISKKDYNAILKWAEDAKFFTKKDTFSVYKAYYYDSEVRFISYNYNDIIDNNVYVFNSIFNSERFSSNKDYESELVKWVYDGEKLKLITLFNSEKYHPADNENVLY